MVGSGAAVLRCWRWVRCRGFPPRGPNASCPASNPPPLRQHARQLAHAKSTPAADTGPSGAPIGRLHNPFQSPDM